MHYSIPPEHLHLFWQQIKVGADRHSNSQFSKFILLLSFKDVKLRFKEPSFEACRGRFISHMHNSFDLDRVCLDETWVDIAFEDTPPKPAGRDSSSVTLLRWIDCLKHWASCMRKSDRHALMQEAIYHWCLTAQAGAAQVNLTLGNSLCQVGVVFAQAYNVQKNLFTTLAKDHRLFDDPNFEGLGLNREVLNGWLQASGKVRPKGDDSLLRIHNAFLAKKKRLCETLTGAETANVPTRV